MHHASRHRLYKYVSARFCRYRRACLGMDKADGHQALHDVWSLEGVIGENFTDKTSLRFCRAALGLALASDEPPVRVKGKAQF
jgi:hypothetical protein